MWRVLVASIALIGLAGAASVGGANLLLNGGFETGNLANWNWGLQQAQVVSGPWGQWLQGAAEGDWFATWYVQNAEPNWIGVLSQNVNINPGTYYIDLSGWVYAWNSAGGSAQWQTWIEVGTLVDGEAVDIQYYDASQILPGWNYFEIRTGPWQVQNSVGVQIVFEIGQQLAWHEGAVDGIDLEIYIPEPSTIALLLTGLAGVGAFIRRR